MKNQYAWLRMVASYKAAVNASVTFAEIFGEALPDDVKMVKVVVEASTTLRINPVAAATAANGGIGQNAEEHCWGNKTELDRYEFYTGGANNISFFVYT